MAEFKLRPALNFEIQVAKMAAEKINENYAAVDDDEVNTLKTSVAIIEQHKKIKGLLELYKQLVKRDMADLSAMADEANRLDDLLGNVFRV